MSEDAARKDIEKAQIVPAERPRRVWRYRHALPVRLTHWITAGAILILLMSGLQIFNAHPALYWGDVTDFDNPVFTIDPMTGTNRLLGAEWGNGLTPYDTALPSWMTLPAYRSLPDGRLWHFFFAWVLVGSLALYLAWGLVSRHLQRDIVPRGRDFRNLPASAWQHMRLKFHDAAGRYSSVQKISYAAVLFVVLPLIILTGLTMSPAMNAAWPFLVDLFGGRQSARTIHFICAIALALFAIVHVVMALLSGPINALVGIVTGWRRERIETEDQEERGDER